MPFFSQVEVPGLAGTGLGHRDARYDLLVDDPTASQRLLDLLPGLGYLVIVVLAGYLVLRVMRDIGRGDPFRPHNVRRLRALAALLAFGWPVVVFAEVTCRFTLVSGLDLGDLGPRAAFDVPVLPLVVGITVALVAEAFKAGSRLPRRRGRARLMPVDEPHRIVCHLDRLLEERGMTLAALAGAVGVTVVNLSVLKNNRAKAIRYSTLTAICDVLGCEVGDLLTVG